DLDAIADLQRAAVGQHVAGEDVRDGRGRPEREDDADEDRNALERLGLRTRDVGIRHDERKGDDGRAQTEAFKGISIFIGIVFSLGSSSAISNILAGYMLTYRRALKIGDRVKIGTAVGEVIATRLQVTHLRSMKNEEIIIPNSQITAAEVLNYSSLSRARGLILHTDVG